MASALTLHNFVLLLYVGLLCWAAISDFRWFKIPNRIVASILILYPAHVLSSPADIVWHWDLVTALVVFVVGFILFQFRVMGGGDVKLLVGVVLWSGMANVSWVMIVTVLAGVCLIPVSAFLTSLKFARQEAAEMGGDAAALNPRVLASAVSGMRFVHLKGHWIPYGVAIAAGGIFVVGQSLMQV